MSVTNEVADGWQRDLAQANAARQDIARRLVDERRKHTEALASMTGQLDQANAAITRVRNALQGYQEASGRNVQVNAQQILDLLDPEGMWSCSFAGPAPEGAR